MEKYIDIYLDRFEKKAKTCILDFFKEEQVPFTLDEEKAMCSKIRNCGKGYFTGKKSPHGLMSEEENYAVDICEIIEDILEEKNITIPDDCREDYEEPLEDQARLFGDTYYQMEDDIALLFKETKTEINFELYPNEHKNAIHNLILALNNTREWECYDIDNYDFINFVCKTAEISEEEYRMVMKEELALEEAEELEEEFEDSLDKIISGAKEDCLKNHTDKNKNQKELEL